MQETHMFVLWDISDKSVVLEVENKLIENFELLSKSTIGSISDNINDEIRVKMLNIMYRNELDESILRGLPKGKSDFNVYLVSDKKPKYELIRTKRQHKHFNSRVLKVKKSIRSGRPNFFHAADNTQEVHDNLKAFSDLEINNVLYRNWLANRPSFNTVEEFFKALNSSGLDYVVLRNFEDYTKQKNTGFSLGEDVDILVDDYFLCKSVLGGIAWKNPMLEDGGWKICNKVLVANREIDVDIRYVGDNYYCEPWQKQILETKEFNGLFYTPDKINHFYSVLYHALCHKKGVPKSYKEKLVKFDIGRKAGVNTQTVESEKFLFKVLSEFMAQNKYMPIRPDELSIAYRDSFDKMATYGY